MRRTSSAPLADPPDASGHLPAERPATPGTTKPPPVALLHSHQWHLTQRSVRAAGGELCHISMVFVHPNHGGRRLGLLLLEGISGARQQTGILTPPGMTGKSNDRAQHLYRRAGFTPSGRTLLLDSGEPVFHFVRPASYPERSTRFRSEAAPGRRGTRSWQSRQ
ncbi:GNAT family N-acetyltransferase [Streptomyces sp. CMB-StM0423]|uniref:GNAT family N-acetyltransferase n=1 Tax=Streptomyces sp. CMB-StM0423 TaxID=2059884 RepID=UPI003FA38F13